MQHGAGEITGKKEVGAAADDHEWLRKGVPVKGWEIGLIGNLNIQGTLHLDFVVEAARYQCVW